MRQSIKIALRMCLLTMLVAGLAYPLVMTGVAAMVFPSASRGSLVTEDGAMVGSRLIGQQFASERYFWSRPSAVDNDASGSGASNLAPTSTQLIDQVAARVAHVRAGEGIAFSERVPVDAVTTSGSGLDPHISPEWARLQIARVARVRGLPASQVARLVEAHTESRQLGILGEPRVNVLELNLALDLVSQPQR